MEQNPEVAARRALCADLPDAAAFFLVPKSVESSGFDVSLLVSKLSQQVGAAA